MRLKPLLSVLSLSLFLGAIAQTVVTTPSNAIVSFTIDDMPGITSPSSADGTLGMAFNYQITGINSPTSYSASGLPAGLNLNTSTGLITGTPTAFGVFSVTLSATNDTGTSSTTITLNIVNYVDSDGDGINDVWEMNQFGSLATCNATSRNNLDGLLDRDEYLLGLDPTKHNLTAPENNTSYVYNLKNELIKCTAPVTSTVLTFSPDSEGNLK